MMFATFFKFEIRYWLRGMMVYVFFAVIALMIFAAVSSDHVQVGVALENTHRNAPFTIQNFYAIMAILTSLMITAFVNSAASRDFMYDTSQILFTKPLHKFGFLLGRFWGATLIAVLPMLGISAGVIIGGWMPWNNDPERWGPISWGAHLASVLIFAIPNTIFVAALVFAIAVWTRSTIASFIGVILLLVGYSISSAMLGDLENETIAKLIDPFAVSTYNLITKYWTVSDRNSQYVGLSGLMLWNRLLWLAFGLSVLALSCWRFSFAERIATGRLRRPAAGNTQPPSFPPNPVTACHGAAARWTQFWSLCLVNALGIVKSHVFVVVLFAGFLNAIASLYLSASEGFGLSSLPVTYTLIEIIRGTLYAFIVAIITFFSGVLVWKERDTRLDEVLDATPHPSWTSYLAKFVALVGVTAAILLLSIVAGTIVQITQGYHRFQWDLYAIELLGLDLARFVCLIILAMLAHTVSPNKYFGYFLFIAILIANSFGWRLLRIESVLVHYGQLPQHTYSDLFRFAPFQTALAWFAAYWLLFAALLGVATIVLWQRGREIGWPLRLRYAAWQFTGSIKFAGYLLLLLWCGTAAWAYYNTRILNEYRPPRVNDQRLADYEQQLKKYERRPQPRITKAKFEIDLQPYERLLAFRGTQQLINDTPEIINELHLTLADGYETEVHIDGAKLKKDFGKLDYQIHELSPPLAPGETMTMAFTVRSVARGFESSLSHPEIVQNGTFFNNKIVPQICYQTSVELQNKNRRKQLKLGEPRTMPNLNPNDMTSRKFNYLGDTADWVEIETFFSTSADQIAIAPGSLVRAWAENGRRHFHYKLDHASLNFYSFISGRFAVRREKWHDVDIEVYYHPEHEWNVPNMLRSIRKSFEYYTAEFGPYRHHQARIIEFPRVAEFAQAFAGTMPYSEGIGFVANLKDPEDIDMVFYVVAHEMAHQWWAHQIVGANMQGATTLSETLAQYSALMVMEREYGRDMMRKFLSYEMDNYLRSRGREQLKERPLNRVEAQQGYIHYRKGSVVMYYLKELLGEDKVNAALRSLIKKFAYQKPPYPTSQDLVDALRAEAPEQYQPMIGDLFEDITLFANRVVEARYTKRSEDSFNVRLVVDCRKFKADDQGKETEISVDDWIEVGAFAKPDKGKQYGRTLHRERLRLKGPKHTIDFTVAELPDQVGIDPFHLLVDRMPDDNTRRPVPSELH